MTIPTVTGTSHAALGALTALAAAISISFSNILAPAVIEAGTNTATLLAFRFICFLLVCALWMRWSGTSFVLERQHRAPCVGTGIGNAVGSGALIASFLYLPISLAILIFYTFPLLTRLGECAVNRRRPLLYELLCLATALAGLALCLGFGFDRLNAPGLFFAIAAALSISASFVLAGHRLKTIQPTLQTFYMGVTGLVITLAFIATTRSFAPPPFEPVAVTLMLGASVTYAAAFFAIYKGIGMIGASRTAMIMNLEPVLTIGLAILLLQEGLSAHQLVGATMVIAAVVAAQLRPPPDAAHPV